MKRLAILLCFFFLLFLCSCSEDETIIAKREFDKFHTDNNVVLVIDKSCFYFDTHTLDLCDIVKNEEPNLGYFIKDDKIYFSTSRQDSAFDNSLLIYECDLYGQNLNLLFEKKGFKTHPWTTANEGVFYISHRSKIFDASSKVIDSYNVFSKEYKNVASGEECDLYDYKKDVSYDVVEEEYFEIHKGASNESVIIDNAFINSTVYADSMNKFGYRPYRMVESNGHVLLIYTIGVKSGWNYPFLIFEYDIDNDALVYKSLVFPYDVVNVRVEYIG